jgi:hypothetical protein
MGAGFEIDDGDEAFHLVVFDAMVIRDARSIRRPRREARAKIAGRELSRLRFTCRIRRDDVHVNPAGAIADEGQHLAVGRHDETRVAIGRRPPFLVVIAPQHFR